MKAVELDAKWDPKSDFKLGYKDIDGKLTYLGSQVWRNPEVRVIEKEKPTIKPDEVLIKVKRCGMSNSLNQNILNILIVISEYIY